MLSAKYAGNTIDVPAGAAGVLYRAGATDEPISVSKIEEFLEHDSTSPKPLWSYTSLPDTGCMKADSQGNVYVGLAIYQGYKGVYKIDASGNLVWNKSVSISARTLDIDANDNIIVAQYSEIVKYNASGEQIWKVPLSSSTDKLYSASIWGIDSQGNSFWATAGGDGSSIGEYDTNGTLLWALDLPSYSDVYDMIYSFTYDKDDNPIFVYSTYLMKYTKEGVRIWQQTKNYGTDPISKVRYDKKNEVLWGMGARMIYKINANTGKPEVMYDVLSVGQASFELDSLGFLYMSSGSGLSISKVNKDTLEVMWEYVAATSNAGDMAFDGENNIYCLAKDTSYSVKKIENTGYKKGKMIAYAG